ncbi:MAG TPA: permease prefix domain 1-containing protein [Capsulimonadaceae bacterium]|nr:permease prefix domain 1-containing protein [Capsulimonadaceae bacterium]
MSSPLEKYLREVAVQLHELPEARREEEIEEVHSHLLAYAQEQKAAGKSEEEALLAAMDQFGQPREIGRGIVRSVRRATLRAPLFLAVIALIGTVVCLILLSRRAMSDIEVTIFASLFLIQVLLIGLCCGLFAGRPAIKWVGVFYAFTALVDMLNLAMYAEHNIHTLHQAQTSVLFIVEQEFLTILHVPIAAAGAWIGARIAERLITSRSASSAV